MSEKSNQRPVAHIYTFALTWWFFMAIMRMEDILEFIIVAVICAMMSGTAYFISFLVRTTKKLGRYVKDQFDNPPGSISSRVQEPEPSGNLEVDAIICEGFALITELKITKSKIKNESIVKNTDEIIDVSNKIIEKLRRNPELFSSAKRFLNYYLPTTTKLISNYHYMESQGVDGENISGTMQKIEGTLETLKNSYKNQLDSLFSHAALDLSTDIDVLENILKQDGLTNKDFQKE
ncbi:MAG: 5-bromo-4-chloroindolyl phosphate hydrolysis family protein [Defluviitaleaceae bacterium]|nr:5-bromo-4-chloroindolyl phosphate hydrolysis family protein [Defluviitaleaceae bacterium]